MATRLVFANWTLLSLFAKRMFASLEVLYASKGEEEARGDGEEEEEEEEGRRIEGDEKVG